MTSHIKDLFVRTPGGGWLAGADDPVLSWLMRERSWQPDFIGQIDPRSGERILDIGCRTGTLTIALQRACPAADISGLDVDADVLRIARGKARECGACVAFWQGRADDPASAPVVRPSTFDKIVACFLFHHLSAERRRIALAYMVALLRRGGSLHVAEWESTTDLLPPLMQEAGLDAARGPRRYLTVFGSVGFYRGVRR